MRAHLFQALITAALLGIGGSIAHADYAGYICDVTQYKYANTGSSGYLDVSFYSAAHCGGTRLGDVYYCSKGATWAWCAADANFLLTENELLTLRQAMLDAGRWGNQVSGYTTPCRGGDTRTCGGPNRVFLYPNR